MKTKTPICDFVKQYAERKYARFHMPGHKGRALLGSEPYDITEITGADSLYEARGIIAESQANATELFGTGATFYSAEGSSQCIRAMLYLSSLVAANKGRKPLIAATRNAHKVFALTAALLDMDVIWLNGDVRASLCDCSLSPERLDEALAELKRLPDAVFITSPDYLGNIADVKGLAETAHRYGCLLICDNAHGAYLKFLDDKCHPMDVGADMCCDSAHKTLPCLTGGAYLHIGKNAPQRLKDNAADALAMFGSTSPSYLILQSLDKVNGMLIDGYAAKIKQTAERVKRLKNELTEYGYTLVGSEPLKITVNAKRYGYDGRELAKILADGNVIAEYFDADFTVLMVSAENDESDLNALERALKDLPKKPPLEQSNFAFKPVRVTTMKQALTADTETVDVTKALGRVLACPTVSCPPAVPVLYGGELINEQAVETFLYYGITEVKVVK